MTSARKISGLITLWLIALLSAMLVACGGGGGTPGTASEVAPTITLASVATQPVTGGKPVVLGASTSGAAVLSWQLAAGSPGSLSATGGASVNYLPPASGVSTITPVTVTVGAGSTSKSFNLTLYPNPGPAGLSLIAGNPDAPLTPDVDGQGAEARFEFPRLLAADGSGNIYVVEALKRGLFGDEQPGLRLRKITPDGTVTTLAAPASWWGKPAIPPDGAISNVGGIDLDRQGNIYIADTSAITVHGIRQWGGAIVKITPDGVPSIFAGKHDPSVQPTERRDGAGESARFMDNMTIAGFDADGNLYVDDGAIRRITPAGVVSTVAALPAGLGADAEGNGFVTDPSLDTVLKVTPAGVRTVVAGVPRAPGAAPFTQLGALPGRLNGPLDIVRIGPTSFAVISGNAVLKLVLP